MKLSALIAPLIAAQAPHDQIMAVVMAFEAQQNDALEQRRRADAERQSRKRSRDITLHHSDTSLAEASAMRGEDKPLPQKIEPQESKKEQSAQARDVSEFRSVLSDLDDERLNALVKHRRSKRGSITGHAARLFIRDAEACALSLADATDTCISRNWITVKPEFLAPRARGSPSNAVPQLADVFSIAGRSLADERSSESGPGPRQALPDLSLVRSR